MIIDNPYKELKLDNNRNDWWNNSNQGLHYAEYIIDNSIVMIGNRPDFYGTTNDFYKSVDGWINVSDRFVRHEKNVNNLFLPWNEGGQPQIEIIFSFLKTLDYWINELKLKRIYISCDGGTHRAPSMFGFYLLSYEKLKAKEINNNYRLVNRDHWSNPLEYANTYLKQNNIPCFDLFLNKFKDNTKGDCQFGVSLDSYLNFLGKDNFTIYYRDRFMNKDLFSFFYYLRKSFIWFIVYTLYQGPKSKFKVWIHKKLGTKKGQWYKKHRF